MNLLKIFDFWSWPINAYRDFREWKIVSDACKEPETINALKKSPYEIRIDKLSRIYTVIDVPADLAKNPNTYWSYLITQLNPINDILMGLGIGDILVPSIERIAQTQFLIILYPKFDALTLKASSLYFLKIFGYWFVLGTLLNIVEKKFNIELFNIDFSSFLEYLPI